MGVTVILQYQEIEGMLCFSKPSAEFMFRVQQVLDKCKDKNNGYVAVTLDKPRKPRTTGEGSQNNLFWELCTKIANEVGDDSDGMRDTENGIKMRALSRGYPFRVNKLTGEKVPESMTKVDTVQMSYLIDTAYQICSELNINVQVPASNVMVEEKPQEYDIF